MVYCLDKWFKQNSSFWKISSRNRIYVPFEQISSITPEKRPQRPETGIKDGFEEIEHQFPFLVWNIPSEKKQNCLYFSVAPRHF